MKMKNKSNAGVAVGKGYKAKQPSAHATDKSNAQYPGFKKMEYPTPSCNKKKV
jgi:hypothetical protein